MEPKEQVMDNNPNTQNNSYNPQPPQAPPPETPLVQPQVEQQPPKQLKSALAIWSLSLGIAGLVMGVIVFISLPLALIGLILGIIALKKRVARKKTAIWGVSLSGFTLLVVVPIMAIVTLVAYNGVTERANQNLVQAQNLAAGDRLVEQTCFTFTAPDDYSFVTSETGCSVVLQSDFKQINVGPLGEDVSTLDLAVKGVESGLGAGVEISPSEASNINGYSYYKMEATSTDSEIPVTVYIIVDKNETFTVNGETATSYAIIGPSDTAERTEALESVLSTFIIKTE